MKRRRLEYYKTSTANAAPIKMKAETNAANGGIGVSYSNVVLAGGFVGRSNSVAQIGGNG